MGSRASVLKLLRSYLKWYGKFYRSLINMNSVKMFLICAFAIFQIIVATDPDVAATAHEEASNVDPYAAYNAYYAAYGNQAQSSGQYITEKQSYGDQVKEFMGPDAAIVLGTIGSILGSLAVIGIGINAANVASLSTDQDSICTAVKTLGAIDVSSATTTDTTTGTELNALITAIEAVSTPSC